MTRRPSIAKEVLYPALRVERHPPENYVAADREIFAADDFATVVRDVHVATIPQASVVSMFLFRGPRLLHEYCRHTPASRRDIFKSYVKRAIYPPRTFTRAYAATSQWADNYFHWLTELYPAIVVSLELLGGAPILMPRHLLALPFVQQSLELLDIEPIPYRSREVLRVEELLATNEPAVGHYNVPFLLDMRSRVLMRVGPDREATRRVFVSRQKAPNKRILNEKDVRSLVSGLGFETVTFEDLDFTDQIRLMQETRLLIGPLGAGFANCMFMPRGGGVYELRPEKSTWNSYFRLSRAVDLEYYYQRCPSDGGHFNVSDLRVDLDVLAHGVETMIRDLEGKNLASMDGT